MAAKIMTYFIFLLPLVLLGGCNSAKQEYGNTYGAPEAVLGSELPTENKFYSGEVLSDAPDVKPTPSGNVHHVRLDATHKMAEIFPGMKYRAWTFGDTVPGPVMRIKQGDKVIFTLTNRAEETVQFVPPMPHSIDLHAAMLSPQDKYRTIDPGKTLTFEWTANYPGVFMYHCATVMVLQHLAAGMYGMTIVEPKGGYPTKVDQEYAVVQSEFYPKENPESDGSYEFDLQATEKKDPTYVVFNGKFMRHMDEPLKAKPGDRVRLYFLNAGPNDTSSFHVIGTIFDKVWLDGNPANELRGMQTVMVPASGSAIVEFVVPEAGQFVMVDHEFADAHHGAMGVVDASQP